MPTPTKLRWTRSCRTRANSGAEESRRWVFWRHVSGRGGDTRPGAAAADAAECWAGSGCAVLPLFRATSFSVRALLPDEKGNSVSVRALLPSPPSPCERCCLMKYSALTRGDGTWTNETSMRITPRALSSCQSIFSRTISTEHFWILTLEKFRSYCQPGGLLHLLSQTGAWDC